MTAVRIERLGTLCYHEGLAWQQARAAEVRSGASEAIAVLQHEPVYTLGMRGSREHVLASEQWLASRGAAVVETDRGGDVTFHGPGQLVAYPILDIRALGFGAATYVRMLESCVIETLATFGINADRVPGRPGVWVEAGVSKIAAVGVRIRDGVSTHGFALNVSTNLEWFEAIVPCGIADAGVTSMAQVLGDAPPHKAVEDTFLDIFARTCEAARIESQVVAAR